MIDFTIKKVIEFGETYFVYNERKHNKNIYLNSTFSSEKEAEKFVEQIKPNQLNIVVGIGNGTIFKKLNEIDFVHCLIIEPFEDVKINEYTYELIKTKKNISFYYYKDISSLIINEYIKKFLGLNVNILIHPKYEKTNKELLNDIIKLVKDGTVLLQVNKNTENYFRKDWIIEPLINLEYTMSQLSIGELEKKFEGETAILAASGPSLKQNIPFIKNMKNNSYLFAVGSALNALLSENINPDFVTVIDSSIKNYTAHFKGVDYKGPLIISGMVNSNILKNHKGPSILANLNIDSITSHFREDVPVFPSVPSVAVFTLQTLYFLGFSKVYLVGQDLALINGEYYAKDVRIHQNTNIFESQLFVESNNGSKVGTIYSLFAHLQAFENLIEQFDKNKMEIYNLSENGAKIKGVDYISSDSIYVTKKRKDILIEYLIKDEADNNIEVIKEFILKLENLHEKTNEILTKLNKINKNAVNMNDLKRVLKIFKELRKQNIVEDILLKQLSFYVQKLNNKFEFSLDKEITTNEDRMEMVNDIIKLVTEVQKYLKEILNDDRINSYLN